MTMGETRMGMMKKITKFTVSPDGGSFAARRWLVKSTYGIVTSRS